MIPGQSSNSPDKLCACIKNKYFDLRRDVSIFMPETKVVLLETWRDITRQKYYVEIGTSKTMNSKHLGQGPFDLSLAFDIAIVDYMQLKHWNPKGIKWQELRKLGRDRGLICNIPWDLPHYQLNKCECK